LRLWICVRKDIQDEVFVACIGGWVAMSFPPSRSFYCSKDDFQYD